MTRGKGERNTQWQRDMRINFVGTCTVVCEDFVAFRAFLVIKSF